MTREAPIDDNRTPLVAPVLGVTGLDETLKAAIEREALRLNDRYLAEFIEGRSFCPFAGPGRKRGETARFCVFAESPDPEPLIELMVEIGRDPQKVVTQVIFPMLEVDPRAWAVFIKAASDEGNRRLGVKPTLAGVALHPEDPYRTDSPAALVPIFRRSPDPTIQWTRIDVIEELYKGREHKTTFLSPEEIIRFLEDPPDPRSLFDQIAEANVKTMEQMGGERALAEALGALRREALARYAALCEDHGAGAPG